MDKFLSSAATLFGVGHFPKAPGTMGSLVALILGSVLIHYIAWPEFLVIILVLFGFGVIAANAHERLSGVHDSPKVVIDELVGMWMVLFPLEAWGSQLGDFRYDAVLGFIAFRAFDIFKPWPISYVEAKTKGGLGTMADDAVAGVFASAVLMIAGYFI